MVEINQKKSEAKTELHLLAHWDTTLSRRCWLTSVGEFSLIRSRTKVQGPSAKRRRIVNNLKTI